MKTVWQMAGNDLNKAEYKDKLNLITTTRKSQPNFVFILADDLGYNSIGYEAHDLTSVAPYLTSLSKGKSIYNLLCLFF
jgi:hypothetical protein